MYRWCSASSIRGTQSEMGESVKSDNQIALSQLVEKKTQLMVDFLSKFHNSVRPNISGILYQRTDKEIDGLIQSRLSASRMMGANELNGINSSYFPPSILNGSIALNSHLFKQPLPPVQRFQPEPIFNQDNRENSTVLNSFAKINEVNQASLRNLSANSKITQNASLRTNPRITQEANNSILERSICLNNRNNAIRKKGFLNKKPTKQAPQSNISVQKQPIQYSVVQTGISEKEDLIQEDELSDESVVSERPSKRKKSPIKVIQNKHVMPTPSTSRSSNESFPESKIPRMHVEEEIIKKVNIEPVSSTNNIEKRPDFDFIIKKWTLVLVDKTLRIYGDKYNKNGSTLIKPNVTSGSIKAFVKTNKSLVKTEKCVYMLDGKLYDPDNAVPDCVKSMCRNGDFPKFWRKAMTTWIKMESETEKVPASQESSKNEDKISKPQKAKERKNVKERKKQKPSEDVKKPNSKRKVKEHETNETNKKQVLDLMMTNDSILCTSMTPNGLLNSIKKNGNELIFTPPSKLLNEIRGNETEKSNQTDSDDDYAGKINKPNPVVGRFAKVVAKPKKPQRQLKPKPKPKSKAKIPMETSYQDKSFCFSDLSSIEDSD